MVTQDVDILDRGRRLKRFLIAGLVAVVLGVIASLAAWELVAGTDEAGVTSRQDLSFVGTAGAVAFCVAYFGLSFLLKRRDQRADRAKAHVVSE